MVIIVLLLYVCYFVVNNFGKFVFYVVGVIGEVVGVELDLVVVGFCYDVRW